MKTRIQVAIRSLYYLLRYRLGLAPYVSVSDAPVSSGQIEWDGSKWNLITDSSELASAPVNSELPWQADWRTKDNFDRLTHDENAPFPWLK